MFDICNPKVKFDFVKDLEKIWGISERPTRDELQEDSGCLADVGRELGSRFEV